MPEDSTDKPAYTIKTIFREVTRLAGPDFPEGELRNRLLNLGLKEVISKQGSIIRKNGFPFKFNRQLDEAILALAHFLDRFRNEGGSLDIYALNRVSKAEDKTLSFWQDAKTKLYLELQNLILLLNGRGGRKSSISRIFAFRELSDLAFLTQGGINVLAEHLAIGVEVGFMFQDSFDTTKIAPISDTVIINFIPSTSTPKRHNFYQLYMLTEESKRYDLPYQEVGRSKWFSDLENAKSRRSERPRLESLLALYKPAPWHELSPANSHLICKFDNEAHFFNDATIMMYRAFVDSEFQKQQKGADTLFIDRVNKTVITRDMIRLHRTMSAFDGAEHISAVDATSTKSSLKIHETRPTYRDWLRRSLNRVLKFKNKTLHRIYILKGDLQDPEIEYPTLLRLMQYYLDYFHYEIAEMSAIVHMHQPAERRKSTNFRDQKWFQDQWESFPNRVSIHITTSEVLQTFTDAVLTEEAYPQMFRRILPTSEERPSKHEYLSTLDYLSTENMIYNFLDPRGDPDELTFPASWFRESFSTEDEEGILFNFTKLKSLKDLQTQNRVNLLGASILQYEEHYKKILEPEMDFNRGLIEEIRQANDNRQGPGLDLKRKDELLKFKASVERKLYGTLKPHFDYLYKVLEYQSVKVDFWTGDKQSLIHKLYPFRDCTTVADLTRLIEGVVFQRIQDKTPLPRLARTRRKTMHSQPKIFLSYAHDDMDSVNGLYDDLADAGYDPWQDKKKIVVGEDMKVTIRRALKQADFFMPVLSVNSIDREGMIQEEMKWALEIWRQKSSRTVYIIPVRLDNEREKPEEFESLLHINLYEGGGKKRLIEDLKVIVARQLK